MDVFQCLGQSLSLLFLENCVQIKEASFLALVVEYVLISETVCLNMFKVTMHIQTSIILQRVVGREYVVIYIFKADTICLAFTLKRRSDQ